MSWFDSAKCNGDKNFDRWFRTDPQTLRDLRDICALCPVRNGCGKAALSEEQGDGIELRSGFRAYMTPEQRVEIEKAGGLQGRDPLLVVKEMWPEKKKRK